MEFYIGICLGWMFLQSPLAIAHNFGNNVPCMIQKKHCICSSLPLNLSRNLFLGLPLMTENSIQDKIYLLMPSEAEPSLIYLWLEHILGGLFLAWHEECGWQEKALVHSVKFFCIVKIRLGCHWCVWLCRPHDTTDNLLE